MTSTKVDTTAISAIMRIRLGISRRSSERNRLERPVTKIKAAPMTSALSPLLVTARVEHMPRIWRVMGLAVYSPSPRVFFHLPAPGAALTVVLLDILLALLRYRPGQVVEHQLDALGSHGRAADPVHLGGAGLAAGFEHPKARLPVGGEELLVFELPAEPAAGDFSAQPGGFLLLVEADRLDGAQIRLQGEHPLDDSPQSHARKGYGHGLRLRAAAGVRIILVEGQ